MIDMNSLLSNRSSGEYSRIPTHEDSYISRAPRMSGKYSLLSHSSLGDEQEWPTKGSQRAQHVASLGARVSIQRLSGVAAIVEEPLHSPGMVHSPGLGSPRSEGNRKPRPGGRTASTAVVNDPTSCWRFVERTWFQAISAVVIIANVVTTIIEMDKPQTESLFRIPDQVMLGFYLIELFSRANYFGNLFLCGPAVIVSWHVLDIVVVVAGVLDQWLMPILPGGTDQGPVAKILSLLRLLRLLRVFKIVRVFLDIDLSWTEKPAFQSFIGIVIMINSLLMGFEIDIVWHGWFYFEQVLLCVYVFELSVRLKNFGLHFFASNNADIVWNVLDFTIVTSSVLDSWITPLCGVIAKSISGHSPSTQEGSGMSLGKVMMLMRMLRLMRILRLAKLVKSIQPLFILVTGVMAALQGVVWVLVLTIVTLYAMGILATSLIGKKMGFPPETEVPDEILKPFSTVPTSMFTLFRVMSGAASDAESTAIDDLMENLPALRLGFVFFMITSSWTLLSILTAVVSDNMISTTGQQEEEIKIQNAEEDRTEHVEKLTELFNKIDVGGDGQVERDEIEEFLSNKDNAILTARRCRVPVRDVREVLQTVAEACEGTTVSIATFVDNLADVSKPVTEKSVMKIEAMLNNLRATNLENFSKLFELLGAERQSSSSSKASSRNARARQEGRRLDDIEKSMQSVLERTEACLSEHHQKNQKLLEKATEALQLKLCKMESDLLCSLRYGSSQMMDQSSDVSKARKFGVAAVATMSISSDQESAQKQKPLSWEDAAEPPEAINQGTDMWPVAVDETQDGTVTVTAPGGPREPAPAHIEARLVATEECVRVLQQRTESMLKTIIGPLEWVTSAVDKERVLANETSMHGLLEKTEATLSKIEGFLHNSVGNGPPALALDKLSETLEREMRMMRQELLCSTTASQIKEGLLSARSPSARSLSAKRSSREQEVPLTPKATVSNGNYWSPQSATIERQE